MDVQIRRIAVELEPKQVERLMLVKSHMEAKMGSKLPISQVVRALIASYIKQARLVKDEEGEG